MLSAAGRVKERSFASASQPTLQESPMDPSIHLHQTYDPVLSLVFLGLCLLLMIFVIDEAFQPPK